ncbi:MAG: GAF domain-containing protein, partial [Proteobacteria bacterium]
SSHQAGALPEDSADILIEQKVIAKLRAPAENRGLLRDLLQGAAAQEYRAQLVKQALEESTLLTSDLDRILSLSQLDAISFEDLLKHYLQLLRSHVWVEKCSIFGIYDGFTLEGLAGIGGGPDQQNWKINFSSVAGMAATTRRCYHTENPAGDPNFQAREGGYLPRNLLCYPLLHGNTLVGVLNLSNRIGGEFSAADKVVVERFASVGAHILQKHYFKQRMQTYERTSDELGKYLSSKVVKNVKAQGALGLGGVEKKVVCLFADIRGYTTISQGISPALLVQLLNFHFERMHAIIEKHEGTLDKIVGDLIMAVWNIPHDQPDPELLAMKTALEMQKEIVRVISPEWAKHGIVKMGMGIGVNSGMAVVGNLGSSRFMNYTVIGDTINTAQRLESKPARVKFGWKRASSPTCKERSKSPCARKAISTLRARAKRSMLSC